MKTPNTRDELNALVSRLVNTMQLNGGAAVTTRNALAILDALSLAIEGANAPGDSDDDDEQLRIDVLRAIVRGAALTFADAFES